MATRWVPFGVGFFLAFAILWQNLVHTKRSMFVKFNWPHIHLCSVSHAHFHRILALCLYRWASFLEWFVGEKLPEGLPFQKLLIVCCCWLPCFASLTLLHLIHQVNGGAGLPPVAGNDSAITTQGMHIIGVILCTHFCTSVSLHVLTVYLSSLARHTCWWSTIIQWQWPWEWATFVWHKPSLRPITWVCGNHVRWSESMNLVPALFSWVFFVRVSPYSALHFCFHASIQYCSLSSTPHYQVSQAKMKLCTGKNSISWSTPEPWKRRAAWKAFAGVCWWAAIDKYF